MQTQLGKLEKMIMNVIYQVCDPNVIIMTIKGDVISN